MVTVIGKGGGALVCEECDLLVDMCECDGDDGLPSVREEEAE